MFFVLPCLAIAEPAARFFASGQLRDRVEALGGGSADSGINNAGSDEAASSWKMLEDLGDTLSPEIEITTSRALERFHEQTGIRLQVVTCSNEAAAATVLCATRKLATSDTGSPQIVAVISFSGIHNALIVNPLASAALGDTKLSAIFIDSLGASTSLSTAAGRFVAFVRSVEAQLREVLQIPSAPAAVPRPTKDRPRALAVIDNRVATPPRGESSPSASDEVTAATHTAPSLRPDEKAALPSSAGKESAVEPSASVDQESAAAKRPEIELRELQFGTRTPQIAKLGELARSSDPAVAQPDDAASVTADTSQRRKKGSVRYEPGLLEIVMYALCSLLVLGAVAGLVVRFLMHRRAETARLASMRSAGSAADALRESGGTSGRKKRRTLAERYIPQPMRPGDLGVRDAPVTLRPRGESPKETKAAHFPRPKSELGRLTYSAYTLQLVSHRLRYRLLCAMEKQLPRVAEEIFKTGAKTAANATVETDAQLD